MNSELLESLTASMIAVQDILEEAAAGDITVDHATALHTMAVIDICGIVAGVDDEEDGWKEVLDLGLSALRALLGRDFSKVVKASQAAQTLADCRNVLCPWCDEPIWPKDHGLCVAD